MLTEKKYKFITIRPILDEEYHPWDTKPAKQAYAVQNNGSQDVLGKIEYYARWRQYCFCPTTMAETVFSSDCLEDIQDFIGMLTSGKY